MNKRYHNDLKTFDFTKPVLILGLGQTGYSCAIYCLQKNCSVTIADTRSEPPFKQALLTQFPEVSIKCTEITRELLNQYEQFLVSPGISIKNSVFVEQIQANKLIIGDIALFLQENFKHKKTPIIAVTGSNGKSTVVALVEHIASHAGLNAYAGGNIGVSALELLNKTADLYVLELSSFQLETIPENFKYFSLIKSATVLNVSPDHMDRYDSFTDYQKTKEKIYQFAEYCIVNKDETMSESINNCKQKILFGQTASNDGEYGLIAKNKSTLMIVAGQNDHYEKIISSRQLKIKGQHNYLNLLSALALLQPIKLKTHSITQALVSFTGLKHRCQWIAEYNQRQFYNDSKGTNTGATIAAIKAFEKDIILIAGGVGKNADFSDLARVIHNKVKSLIVFGKDAEIIIDALKKYTTNHQKTHELLVQKANDLHQALVYSYRQSEEKDIILFSPACASFDMFKNFKDRGEKFISEVHALIASEPLKETKGV